MGYPSYWPYTPYTPCTGIPGNRGPNTPIPRDPGIGGTPKIGVQNGVQNPIVTSWVQTAFATI